jgi:hypothetical protein
MADSTTFLMIPAAFLREIQDVERLIHFYANQISDQTALSTDRRTPRRLHVFPWSTFSQLLSAG